MMTAVEFMLRPTEARMMAEISTQIRAPLNMMSASTAVWTVSNDSAS
ncbi:hypothetical protein NY406_07875 [Chlorobaculum sp. MV4-Y]|nr:hypothetical protein [Chlorobaculum sp. MV4-Y]UWX57134.1 hypothetical protein NY406_07875 [Chlorobaculum sp. MV4-Y]